VNSAKRECGTITVAVAEINALEGCDDDSGSISITVNGSTKNTEGYIITTDHDERSFNDFKLTDLEKGTYKITATLINGDEKKSCIFKC